MKKDNLIKFRHGNHKGVFTYSVLEDAFVSLSKDNTGKIDYIREHGTIDLSFDLKSETYDIMAVDVISDKEYVQKVYDHFQKEGNSYFNDGVEGLCVLRFHK